METSQALPGAPGQPSSHLGPVTGPRRHADASHPPSCRSQPLLTGPHTGTPLRAHEADLSSLSGCRGKTPRRRVACTPHSSPQAPARKGWCLPSLSGIFRSQVRVKTEQEGSLPGASVPSLPQPRGAPCSVPRQCGPAAPSSEPPPHQLSAPPSDGQARPPAKPHRCLSDSLLSDPEAQARSWPPCTPNTQHPQEHDTETPSRGPPQR